MSTAPFSSEVLELHAGTHRSEVSLAAVVPGLGTVPLDLLGGTVAWSERRSPRVRADLRCAIPDPAVVAALDPRGSVRLQLTVAYTLPDGSEDAHQVADLGLRTMTEDLAESTVTLEAVSDEALVIDIAPNWQAADTTTYEPVSLPHAMAEVIDGLLADGPTGGATTVVTVPATAPAAPIPWPPTDYWDWVVDSADELDADVYDNGDRVFRIAPRPVRTSVPALTLRDGVQGTVLSSGMSRSREEWANFVVIRHAWRTTAGAAREVIGWAKVTAGPYTAALSGHRLYHEQRDTPATQAAVNRAAKSLLRRMASRSRYARVTAVAAWWVRPGHTVALAAGDAAPERHLVSEVVYDIAAASMTITTRLPDIESTYGGA